MPRPEENLVLQSLKESLEVKTRLLQQADQIVTAADLLVETLAGPGESLRGEDPNAQLAKRETLHELGRIFHVPGRKRRKS